jgi:hypothetical protein
MQYKRQQQRKYKTKKIKQKNEKYQQKQSAKFQYKKFQNSSQKLVNIHIVEKFIRTSLYFKAYNTSRNEL